MCQRTACYPHVTQAFSDRSERRINDAGGVGVTLLD